MPRASAGAKCASPDVFGRFANDMFWRDPCNAGGVPMIGVGG